MNGRPKHLTADIPKHERSISEEYRIAAKEWVEAEKAAALNEELKTSTLSRLMLKQGDGLPVSRAEMLAKSSDEWQTFIAEMVAAREAANFAKVKVKWVEMRFREWQSHDANARQEYRMVRQAT